MNNNRNIFPRQLTPVEKMLLFSILPENKAGYNSCRNKISTLVVTGSGRFGGGNFILGQKGTIPDLSVPSSPVFALGTNVYRECTIDITLHEEAGDEIEYDISARSMETIPEVLTGIKEWNYSVWNPGDKAPDDNSFVREINIAENKYILAVAPAHRKIWLHEYETGVNYLIPVTNFYNELMRVTGNREASVALKPASFFENLTMFSDEQLVNSFFSYNRYLQRFNIIGHNSDKEPKPAKKNFFSFFRRDYKN